ncbi:MAG: NAD(P)/FAD-dependent oxidoreductase [Granulicella sp.]
MSSPKIDVAIIGAGPYGLSIAAHLSARKVSYRIFGTPMSSWRTHMLWRTLLKSDGFASNLYDPGSTFTLADYCREQSIPYADLGLPVSIATFAAYGVEFQKRFVPELEQTDVTHVERTPNGFELTTANGDTLLAKSVVVAAGITHFGYIPPVFADVPQELVTHSSQYRDVDPFRGRSVGVIGAGASAVDMAALLYESGAQVQLVARRDAIAFHEPSVEPRPLSQRLRAPRSGLGLGWRSRICSDAPLVFHALPEKLRLRAVKRHLGPAPGWFARDRFNGNVTTHMSTRLKGVSVQGNEIAVTFTGADGSDKELRLDHVIAATGYKVSLQRLGFLSSELRQQIAAIEDTPILSRNFESSVRGLYLVGLASANSFGPLCRFAYGAGFTSKRLSRHLAASS